MLASVAHKRWTNGDAATGSTDPNVTNDCTYWANGIESGDTCETLEAYFDISQEQLIRWNPGLLPDYCNLISGWSYCVSGPAVNTNTIIVTTTTAKTPAGTLTYDGTAAPTQSGMPTSCSKYYLVQKGDTCYVIQDKYMSFTLGQFYAWNPSIQPGCKNLEDGYYVCVGNGTSTSSPVTVTATTTMTPVSSSSAFPTQSGVASNCNKWFYTTDGTTCDGILDKFGLTIAQFYSWNPAVGPTCTGLWLEVYVCVGVSGQSSTSPTITSTTKTTSNSVTSTSTNSVPSPHQTGIALDCVAYYKAKSGDSCWSIVDEKYTYLTKDTFIKWNPALGSSCALLADEYYCVAVTDAQPMPGTISTCSTWHLAISGDGCWAIGQQYGITAAQFNQWNPKVGSDCANLWLGYYVCVGV
ncbi:hypothetical protein VI817_001817 [Penicillium citrinum]|nr:hypothetical protein VI817_001817 [Penicillium citrinum]